MLTTAYVFWTAAMLLTALLIVPMAVSAWRDRDWLHLTAFTLLVVVWGCFAVLWVVFSQDIGVIR